MSKLLTLDEVEEYEREVQRAHAENRAPALEDPAAIARENLGNADSHLVEKTPAELKTDTAELHKEQKEAHANDKRLTKVIRDNIQAVDAGKATATPIDPDPKNYEKPTGKEQSATADKETEGLVNRGKTLDDAFSDSNIPNLEDGYVKGDSVNPKLTRKQQTTTGTEAIREMELNAVPVPERYRNENPPNIVQQGDPVPTPEPVKQEEGKVLTADDVPLTAISVPYPEHVISDETGTTREKVFPDDNGTPVEEMVEEWSAPTVPITDRQVLQGAVKNPTNADNMIGIPADSYPFARPENPAQKAVKKQIEEAQQEALKVEQTRQENLNAALPGNQKTDEE